MKANIACSTEEDSRRAGKVCGKKAVLDLGETKLAILFNSPKHNIENLLNGFKEEIGTAPIIGCSTRSAIMTSEGYINSHSRICGFYFYRR